MSRIEPNPDSYGSFERFSALADILELQALRGRSATPSELADYIKDNNWTRRLGERFRMIGGDEASGREDEQFSDLAEEVDASEQNANEVFEVIRERWEVLGDRYPFEIKEDRVVASELRGRSRAYLLLLAVSVAHAYKISGFGVNPRQAFEDLVTGVLAARGFLAANLGRERRACKSFDEALDRVVDFCRLRSVLAAGLVRRSAQDEGVDVIAHFDWRDERPLHWVYIVQATCGKSDEWPRKLMEPAPGKWKSLLGLLVEPRPVLAVPHHMTRRHASYLAEQGSSRRLILDRLRLSAVQDLEVEGAGELLGLLDGIEVAY